MTITPDQARELLDLATTGPWELRDTDALMNGRAFHLRQSGKPGIHVSATTYGHNGDPELIAAAPVMAAQIAGMQWEYGVEQAIGTTQWFRSRPMAEAHAEVRGAYRLVRRLVGPVEVTE